MKFSVTFVIALILLFTIQACGGDVSSEHTSDAQQQEEGLSEFELEHGIGPITGRIEISDELDQELVTKGRNIYEMKCEMCHSMVGRMVGPELGNVLDRRSPEFVMNFILNPGAMANDHPVGQEMLREYFTVMPFQNVKEDEARAIVEFLRYYAENN
jgi:cytochrome c2